MIRPDDPSNPRTETSTDELSFQIEPQRAPFFQLMQQVIGEDRWVEVGFVWTAGINRYNAIENWYLYEKTNPDDRTRQPYQWPGWTTGRLAGMTLKLVPSTAPTGLNTGEMRAYLERTNDVTISHVKSSMAQGT